MDTGGGYFPPNSAPGYVPTDPSASNFGVGQANVPTTLTAVPAAVPAAVPTAVPAAVPATAVKPTVTAANVTDLNPPTERGFFGRNLGLDSVDDFTSDAGDYLFRGGQSSSDLATAADKAQAAYLKNTPVNLQSAEGLADARATAQPNLLEKYGPIGAGLAGAAYLGGAFDQAEDPYAEQRAKDLAALEEARGPNRLLASDPNRFMVQNLNPMEYVPDPAIQVQPVNFARAAEGGLMQLRGGGSAQYPRREMLVEGPGTERSDDIPAMLSDGEFVLNAKSVRGADPTGQGNRYRGAQNLYGMMRDFEMRG